MALTAKQEFFCREYLLDLNATAAAVRAGYAEKWASSQAYQLLAKPEIQARISELQSERVERLELDGDYVLRRLLEVDTLDCADILDGDGQLLPVHDWPKAWRQSLSGLDIQTLSGAGTDAQVIVSKIKWPDKLKNIELLGRAVGLFKDKVETTHKFDDLTDEQLDARLRQLEGK